MPQDQTGTDIATDIQKTVSQINAELQAAGILPPPPPPPPGALESFGNALQKTFRRIPEDIAAIPTAFSDSARDASNQRLQQLEQDYPSGGLSGLAGSAIGSALQFATPIGAARVAGAGGRALKAVQTGVGSLFAGQAAGGQALAFRQREVETGEETNDAAQAVNMVGHAAVVGAATFFGIEAFLNPNLLGPQALPKIGQALQLRRAGRISTKQAALVLSKNIPQLIGRGAGIEAVEEFVEQVGTNIVDNIAGPFNPGLFEGGGTAALGGAIGGGFAGGVIGPASATTVRSDQKKAAKKQTEARRKAEKEDIDQTKKTFSDIIDDIYDERKGRVNAVKSKLSSIAKSLGIDTKGLSLEQIKEEIKTKVGTTFDPREAFSAALSRDDAGNVGIGVQTKRGFVDLTPSRGRKSNPFESGEELNTDSPVSEKIRTDAKVGDLLTVQLPGGARIKARVTKATRGRLTLTPEAKQDKAIQQAIGPKLFVRLESGEVVQTRNKIPKNIVVDRKTGKTITRFTTKGRVAGTLVQEKPKRRRKKKVKKKVSKKSSTTDKPVATDEDVVLKSIENRLNKNKVDDLTHQEVLEAATEAGIPKKLKAEAIIHSLAKRGLIERAVNSKGQRRYRLPKKADSFARAKTGQAFSLVGAIRRFGRKFPEAKNAITTWWSNKAKPEFGNKEEVSDVELKNPYVAKNQFGVLHDKKVFNTVDGVDLINRLYAVRNRLGQGATNAEILADAKARKEIYEVDQHIALRLAELGHDGVVYTYGNEVGIFKGKTDGQTTQTQEAVKPGTRFDAGQGPEAISGRLSGTDSPQRKIGPDKTPEHPVRTKGDRSKASAVILSKLMEIFKSNGNVLLKYNGFIPAYSKDVSNAVHSIVGMFESVGLNVALWDGGKASTHAFVYERFPGMVALNVKSLKNPKFLEGRTEEQAAISWLLHELFHSYADNGLKNRETIVNLFRRKGLLKGIRTALFDKKNSYAIDYRDRLGRAKTEARKQEIERTYDEEAVLFLIDTILSDLITDTKSGAQSSTYVLHTADGDIDINLSISEQKLIVENMLGIFNSKQQTKIKEIIVGKDSNGQDSIKRFGTTDDPRLDGTAVVDTNGNPLMLFHATNVKEDFEKFLFSHWKSWAPHFGFIEQAHNRLRSAGYQYGGIESATGLFVPKGQRVFPVFLDIKNPLEVEDTAGFENPVVFLSQLERKGLITEKEAIRVEVSIEKARSKYMKKWDKLAAQDFPTDNAFPSWMSVERRARVLGNHVLRKFLISKGWDGLVYRNEGELGKNDEFDLSYAPIVGPHQIIHAHETQISRDESFENTVKRKNFRSVEEFATKPIVIRGIGKPKGKLGIPSALERAIRTDPKRRVYGAMVRQANGVPTVILRSTNIPNSMDAPDAAATWINSQVRELNRRYRQERNLPEDSPPFYTVQGHVFFDHKLMPRNGVASEIRLSVTNVIGSSGLIEQTGLHGSISRMGFKINWQRHANEPFGGRASYYATHYDKRATEVIEKVASKHQIIMPVGETGNPQWVMDTLRARKVILDFFGNQKIGTGIEKFLLEKKISEVLGKASRPKFYVQNLIDSAVAEKVINRTEFYDGSPGVNIGYFYSGSEKNPTAKEMRENYSHAPRPLPSNEALLADTSIDIVAQLPDIDQFSQIMGEEGDTSSRVSKFADGLFNASPLKEVRQVQKFGKGFLKGVFDASMDMIDWTTKPMVDRLANTPTGSVLREAAREAETEANKIQGQLKQWITDIAKFTGEQGMAEAMLGGKLSPTKLAQILKNTPSKLRGQVKKAVELSRILEPEMDGNSGFSKLQLMIEDKIPVETIAEPLVMAMRKLHTETAKIMSDRGMLQNIHGDLQVFKENPKGKVFVRQFTPSLVNLVASGVSNDNKALNVLIDELVKLNPVKEKTAFTKQKGVTRKQVETLFSELSGAIQNRNGDVIRQTHAEVRRLLEKFPTHIKADNEIVQLLHTDPIVYSMKLANNVALRMSYITQFGQHQFSGKDYVEWKAAAERAFQGIGEFEGLNQKKKRELLREIQKGLEAGTTIEGKHDHPWILRMQYAGEGNNVKPFNELIDVWNRIPLKAPVLGGKFLPGRDYYKVGVFMDESLKLYKSMLLSTQAVVNIPETFLGAAAAMAGGRNMLTAMGFGRKGKPGDTDNMREFVRMQTQVMYNNGDFTFDRNHKLWSLSRIIREGIGVGTMGKVINELQDITAARAAYLKQLDWGRGESDARDRALLEIMGFSREEAKLMLTPNWKIKGEELTKKASDLRTKFVQDSPGFFVSSSKTVFSESRAGQSRTFKAVFAFTAYARARMRQNVEILRLLSKSYKGAKADPDLFKSANNLAVRHFGFSALQGSLAYMLLAFVFGGPDEVEQQMREALKSPDKFGKFLLTSLSYSLVGGPYAQILRLMTPEGAALPERAVRATFPGAVLTEAYDFMSGRNIYKDRTITERVEAFFSKRIPLGRAATNGLGVLGIADRDPELEAALKGYWRWKRDNDVPFVRVDKFNEDKETKWFRINMRRAIGEMREGRSPEKFIREAVRVKGAKSIKQSLRNRALFRDLEPEQVANVRETLGEARFNRLVSYNNVIEEWSRRAR